MSGPNLGESKPNLGGSSPNLGGPSGKPSQGPTGGPSLGGPAGTTTTKETKKKGKRGAYMREYWKKYRRIQPFFDLWKEMVETVHLQFRKVFKQQYPQESLEDKFRTLFRMAMEGQITYLQEIVDIIKGGEDILSREQKEKGTGFVISPITFERTRDEIKSELDRFLFEEQDMVREFRASMERFREDELECHQAFWIWLLTGHEIERLVNLTSRKTRKRPHTVVRQLLEPLLKSSKLSERMAGLILIIAHSFYAQLPKFLVDHNRAGLVPQTTRNAYQISTWLNNRYNTRRIPGIDYTEFQQRFLDHLGRFHGRVSDEIRAALNGFVLDVFESVAKQIDLYEPFNHGFKGSDFGALPMFLRQDYLNETINWEYDADNQIINQPPEFEHMEEFVDFLDAILKRAHSGKVTNLRRFSTKTGVVRMSLLPFRYLPSAVRNINYLGERILDPWF